MGSDIKSRDGVDLSDVFFNNKGNGRNNLVIEAIKRTALRSGNWAMIPPYNGPAKNTNVNIELGNSKEYKLYNLENDLGETKNVADQNAGILNKMKSKLISWHKSMPKDNGAKLVKVRKNK